MPAFQDLTGKRFNNLTVIRRAPNKGKYIAWECRCDCGNITIVETSNLKNSSVKSCGCKRYSSLADQFTKNETGNRYGRLLVLSQFRVTKNSKIKNGNRVYCHCICDCGNECDVWGSHLRNGSIKSCGCLRKEQLRMMNRTHGLSSTKEYIATKNRKRKELKKGLDASWTLEMEILLHKNFSSCVVCGMTEEEHMKKYGCSLHTDHVYPLSNGNGLKPGNATVLCSHCNAVKQNKNPEELPKDICDKILVAAQSFKIIWEGNY